ncbi:hypothetical protein [Novosphingobium sp. FKTRR1]|uniref:hypothetical protein n=1 Tax=Novosphingobium sp. FKTRR1 TaxID=2879118 RepID=UPI001CF09DC9|nr:hypothetical protein [Novosphingobium sp. FKTRR1]
MSHPSRTLRDSRNLHKAMVEALHRGETRVSVARRFGVTPAAVTYAARRFGLPPALPGQKPKHWPRCPDHLRSDYATLSACIGPTEARAMLEVQP